MKLAAEADEKSCFKEEKLKKTRKNINCFYRHFLSNNTQALLKKLY